MVISSPLTRTISLNGKDYRVDHQNSLVDPDEWDEGFAEGMAPEAGFDGDLTERQWEVILFLRRFWEERRSCPSVYQTCRILGLHVAGFHFLFPSGYQRGACKLAGLSHRAGSPEGDTGASHRTEKTYRIDIWGFLLDPDEWDDRFALLKAHEMKLPGGMTDEHWRVLRFLRGEYRRFGRVPNIHETCEGLELDIQELEGLFPDGYHRGAVKLAGLRAHEWSP